MVVAILAILLTLLLVIGVHEWGHAVAARLFNIKIKKISIGFGAPLLQWRNKRGCEWALSMWPLGGYVQLLNSRISPVDSSDYAHCFDKQPVGHRIGVLLSGAIANLVVAWSAFTVAYCIGLHNTSPLIQSIQSSSIASTAGLKAGDQIVSVQGELTPSWRAVGMELIILWGQKNIDFRVKRAGIEEPVPIQLDLSHVKMGTQDKSLLNSLGIVPNLSRAEHDVRSHSLIEAIQIATHDIIHMTYFFIMVLKQLFVGSIPFSMLLGPIGLFATSIASLAQGLAVFFYFIASLSLAVAFINLLPIPGLDGGSMVYTLIEKLRGQPVSVAMEVLLHRLMFILFCILLVHLVMNDLQRYFIH